MTTTTVACPHREAEPGDSAAPPRAEGRTRWVAVITVAMMVLELVVGNWTGSLALTADGWHMGTHAGALGIAAFAYWFARTRSRASTFAFGTGKVPALAGYTNAVVLVMVAIGILIESVQRLAHPVHVRFGEALAVAVLGLAVNLVSALLLHPGDPHEHHDDDAHDDDDHHDHDHAHAPHGHGHDHNLRGAYLHVVADALTSILAIGAIVGGHYLGWTQLDPLVAIVGSLVIMHWGVGLCRASSRQLLDVVPAPELATRIRSAVESVDGSEVRDLHVWELAPGQRGCIVSVGVTAARATEDYRAAILRATPLAHLTVEVLGPPD